MKGALPSQRDGGWQQAQLGGTTPSSACGREQGLSGGSEGRSGPELPRTDPEISQGPRPHSASRVLPTPNKLQGKGNAVHG